MKAVLILTLEQQISGLRGGEEAEMKAESTHGQWSNGL